MNVYLGHVSIVCGARDNMNGFGQPSSEMRARNPEITVNDVPITHARRCPQLCMTTRDTCSSGGEILFNYFYVAQQSQSVGEEI